MVKGKIKRVHVIVKKLSQRLISVNSINTVFFQQMRDTKKIKFINLLLLFVNKV